MKKYSSILFLLCLISCTKDMELPFEKSDQKIVINCLFSEDEPWKVTLTRIKSFSDQSDSFVDDARVAIVPENKDTIHLIYSKNGIYTSGEKPTSGTQYQLIINNSKPGQITAKSSIPIKPVISDIIPSTQKAIYFSNPNLTDYEVFPLNFRILGTAQTNFVRFRLSTFNTKKGYLRYSVTEKTIAALREKKLPEDFLSELEKLIGVSFSRYQYYGVIRDVFDKYQIEFTNDRSNIILNTVKETKVKTRYDDSFLVGTIFSNSIWLSNVSRDINNVLGEYSGTQEAALFVDYLPVFNKWDQTDFKEEYWLEVVGMSEDYYKYQKSYIKQVVNQSNPFASVTEVHSNIQNGVGIFAGYNRQMIHFHDY